MLKNKSMKNLNISFEFSHVIILNINTYNKKNGGLMKIINIQSFVKTHFA